MINSTPEPIIRQSSFRDQTMDMRVPLQRASKSMQDRDETRCIVFGFILFVKHVENNTADGLEEAVEKRTVFEKEGAQIFVNGKNTVSVGTGDEFKGHTGRTFLGIFDPAGRTKAAFATKRNKLHVVAERTHIHSAPERRVAAMDHSVNVRNDDRSRTKLINYFFIMVCENFL